MDTKFSWFSRAAALALAAGLGVVGARAEDGAPETVKPVKNVILMIGDGLSFPQRQLADEYLQAVEKRRLLMNGFPVSAATITKSANALITDSAAGGTAIAAGVKTNNGMIGVDSNGNDMETIAEYAKKNGRKVGIVTSVTLNHATPASFYGARANRSQYYELGIDLVHSGFDFFGGGAIAKADKAPRACNMEDVTNFSLRLETLSRRLAARPGEWEALTRNIVPCALRNVWEMYMPDAQTPALGKGMAAQETVYNLQGVTAIPEDWACRHMPVTAGADGGFTVPVALGDGKTVVLAQTFEAPAAGLMLLGGGADWFWEVWCNGELVFSRAAGNNKHPIAMDNHLVAVPVRQGRNFLAVAVKAGSEGFAWYGGAWKKGTELTAADDGVAQVLRGETIAIKEILANAKNAVYGNVYDYAGKQGYKVLFDADAIRALKPGDGKVIAVGNRDGDLPWAIDGKREGKLVLKDFTAKALEMLDNPQGFFLMVEGGKIDWSCHGNDLGTMLHEVIDFDNAVKTAYEFYQKHPEDTLLVVTGDHETGGLTLGFEGTAFQSKIVNARHQICSGADFGVRFARFKREHPEGKFEEFAPMITECYGLRFASGEDPDMTLTKEESDQLAAAFYRSMGNSKAEKAFFDNSESAKAAGKKAPGIVPLAAYMLAKKCAVSWKSRGHTALPVQTSAIGARHEIFRRTAPVAGQDAKANPVLPPATLDNTTTSKLLRSVLGKIAE